MLSQSILTKSAKKWASMEAVEPPEHGTVLTAEDVSVTAKS